MWKCFKTTIIFIILSFFCVNVSYANEKIKYIELPDEKISVRTEIGTEFIVPMIKTELKFWNVDDTRVCSDAMYFIELPQNAEKIYVFDEPFQADKKKKYDDCGDYSLGNYSCKTNEEFTKINEINCAISGDGATIQVEDLFKGNDSEAINIISEYTNKGFKLLFLCLSLLEPDDKDDNIGFIIAVPTREAIDKSALQSAIADAEQILAKESDYYTEYDRYSSSGYIKMSDFDEYGKSLVHWQKEEKAKKGYWFTFKEKYEKAKKVNDDKNALKADVEKATSELKNSMKGFLPKTEVNATLLADAVYYWTQTDSSDFKKQKAAASEVSLMEYEANLEKAREILENLYDKEGKPTNKYSQELIDDLYWKISPTIIFNEKRYPYFNDVVKANDNYYPQYPFINKESYVKSRTFYSMQLPEMLATLEKYEPGKMNKEDYTGDSWEIYEKAYNKVINDLNININIRPFIAKRQFDGSIRDREYPWDFDYYKCQEARKALVSAKDIDIELEYVNNYFTRSGGFNIYRGREENDKSMEFYENKLHLGVGNTNIYSALSQSNITYNFKYSKTICLLYLNGEYIGSNEIASDTLNGVAYNDELKNIQLHDGDKIKVVRVFLTYYKGEASSGYDTTQILTYNLVPGCSAYPYAEQSIANIEAKKIEKPLKVGDKVDFSVDVKGSLLTNQSKDFEKDGIVLFTSNPSKENKISRIEHMTTAKTDKSGRLQYIFAEPGYYTVGFFNMKQDEYFFEDVYRNITPGKYYTMQAGDYQVIKVDAVSEDEEKRLFEQYKAEKLKEAEEYFNDVHEYDFKFPHTYDEVKTWYDNLVMLIPKSKNLKELLETYEVLFNKMDSIATEPNNIRNHKDIIAKLRALLSKLPADLKEANYKHTMIIQDIQKIDKQLNDYQRSLLSEAEQEKIGAAIAKLADGSLNKIPNPLKVTSQSSDLKLANDPGWSTEAGNFNKVFDSNGKIKFYSWSNKTHLDGEDNPTQDVREPVFSRKINEYQTEEADMIPGDRLVMRRYLDTSKEHFGLAYSINGGAWRPADRLELNPTSPGDTKKMFYIDYTMPDGVTGTELKISLKQMSEAEYGAMQLANDPGAKETAKLALEAEFAKYVKTKYTDENWKKIEEAKAKGLKAIGEATSTDAVVAAKNTAMMEMSNVKTIKQETEPGTSNGGESGVALPDFGLEVGKVHVIVENQTFKGSDAAWHGRLIDGWYDLEKNDTMMTSILKALQLKGCHWSTGSQGNASSWDDYGISYLASIKLSENTKGDGSDFVVNDRENRLGEFSGERGSGWMGTLNDWFTNEGFNAFGVRNGKLEDGDEIHVMYTQNLGVDLGGTWGNSDTRIASLDITGKGKLSPNFSLDVKEYMYVLSSGNNDALTINPVAKNKNYLVKTFLNRYNSDSAYFKKTRIVPVKKGDTVYIGCGDKSWPSMNKQGAEARDYTGSLYTIRIVDGVSTFVKDGIKALPTVNRISLNNYTKYESTVNAIKESYDSMNSEEKAKITPDELSAFTVVYEKVKFFAEIDKVKKALAALPNEAKAKDDAVRSAKSDIEKANSLYKALNDAQKKYITIADTANYNKLVERLKTLKVETSAGSISGSEQAPVSNVIEPKTEVKGDTATAKLDANAVNKVITEAAKAGEKKIIIEPQGTENAKAINVSIPKASAEMLAAQKDMSVSVETKSGQVNISAQAMDSIVKEAKGSDISITIALKEKSEVKDVAASKLMENKSAVVVEVKIESAGKGITKFASPIEIMLPVNEKFEVGKAYPVTQISADGSKANLIGKCVNIGGKLYIKLSTDHLSIFVVSPEAATDMPFTDVQGHWAYEAIKYAFENKLMLGVSDDKFSPQGLLSRAMLTTILYRVEKEPKIAEAAKYKDVEANAWYANAVAWASHEGIVAGYSESTFAPNDQITREQMAAMLQRYSKYKKLDANKSKDLSSYKDVKDVSDWASEAVKWSVAEELIAGRTKETLVPKGTATRAEAATILKNYMENVLKSKATEKKTDDKAKATS